MFTNTKIKSSFTLFVATLLTVTACGGHLPTVDEKRAALSQSTSSVPEIPAGKRLLFMGQDSDTIADYQANVPEDLLEGVTLYTQVKAPNPEDTLFGLREKANWGSGDVDFGLTLSSTPYAALAIGLAFDSCNSKHHGQAIANGEYDASIKNMAERLKALSPRPVYLRIGYEFDGPWNCYQQEAYKASYRKMVSIIREVGATNVVSVWHSATWPDPTIAGDRASEYDHRNPSHLDAWYPGDDVVDWVGISTFYRDLHQWGYQPVDHPEKAQQKMVDFARMHKKPLLIAEAAPQAYRIEKLSRGFISQNTQTAVTQEQIWDDWYAPLFKFIDENNDVVKGLAYINTHWEAQPMWYCEDNGKAGTPNCPQGFWGDTRVHANSYIKNKWLEEIQNKDKWVQGKWW